MTDNASILECWLQRRTGVTTASKTEILEVEGVQSDLREINLLRQAVSPASGTASNSREILGRSCPSGELSDQSETNHE
jgi:hypothetical protein